MTTTLDPVFLSQEELKTVVDVNLIGKITASDDTITIIIINESIDFMKSYLSRYYDAEVIFSKRDTYRSLNILKHLKNIVVYELYIRHSRAINEVAQHRYNETMHWLEELNTGKFFDSSLPAKIIEPNTPDPQSTFRGGSNTKYTSSF